MKTPRHSYLLSLIVIPVLLSGAAAAEATAEEAAAPGSAVAEPLWKGSVGLSFLATSGNSETESLGSDLKLERRPTPWGFQAGATFSRVEEDGEKTAERIFVRLRGERTLGERWSFFGGLSGERDRFAGIDLRNVVESGVSAQLVAGPKHELTADVGFTWTREDLVAGGDADSVGAVLAMAYGWKISETTSWTESLTYFPNFDESDDWRLTFEAALAAAVTSRLALKAGYEVRYDNRPIEGFEDTDTTFTTSLVVKFPGPPG